MRIYHRYAIVLVKRWLIWYIKYGNCVKLNKAERLKAKSMDITRNNQQNVVPSLPVIAIFFALVVAGGVLVSLFTPVILPQQASLQARNTDGLAQLLLLIGGAVFFLVQGLLLYAIVRFRAKPNDTGDGVPFHGNATLEIVWTIIPSIVVVILAILSYQVWVTNNTPQENANFVNGEPIAVNAIGARYAWTFEYQTNVPLPLAEGETLAEGQEAPRVVFANANLHTYAGQHVKLDMTTKDVIHSFWVPAMRVKQDLIPGRTTEIRFDPIATDEGFIFRLDESGNRVLLTPEQAKLSTEEANAQGIGNRFTSYRVVCTELCGAGHGNMYAEIIVHETEEAYLANFFNPSIEAVLNPPDDPILLGQAVLASGAYPCANCHILSAQGWAGVVGPALNGIGDRAATRSGAQTGIEYLVESIILPNNYIVPGYSAGQMPHFGYSEAAPASISGAYNRMSEGDLIGIVAYLCSITDSGNPQDSSCELATDDAGEIDPEAVKAQIEAVTATYRNLFE